MRTPSVNLYMAISIDSVLTVRWAGLNRPCYWTSKIKYPQAANANQKSVIWILSLFQAFSSSSLAFIFSRSFLLRTAPHYLNAWNRLLDTRNRSLHHPLRPPLSPARGRQLGREKRCALPITQQTAPGSLRLGLHEFSWKIGLTIILYTISPFRL